MDIDIGKLANKLAEEIERKLIDSENQALICTGQLQGIKLLYEEIKRVGKDSQLSRPPQAEQKQESQPTRRR